MTSTKTAACGFARSPLRLPALSRPPHARHSHPILSEVTGSNRVYTVISEAPGDLQGRVKREVRAKTSG